MGRRSRLEIYFDVLTAVHQGIDKPTRIMYKTNLAWTSLQEVMMVLTERGFVRCTIQGSYKRYIITNKGINALGYYRKSLEGLKPRPVSL